MNPSPPDWLPNWRNPDEYPNPATTTYQQWAWEFLRRNKNYQEAYTEISNKIIDDYSARIDDNGAIHSTLRLMEVKGKVNGFDFSMTNAVEWSNEKERQKQEEHIAQKFRITYSPKIGLPNPAQALPDGIIFENPSAKFHYSSEAKKYFGKVATFRKTRKRYH